MKNLTLLYTLLALLLLPAASQAENRLIHAEWTYQENVQVAGYRLYFNNGLACETADPQATGMDCTVDAEDGESTFFITSYTADGLESPPSQSYTYVFSENLQAAFTADVIAGESPLTVTFDANGSTGNIQNHTWTFGDGTTGSGNTTSHTFTSVGNYTVELMVTDDLGATDRETLVVAVTEPTAENSPPTAVISSSAGVGQAPLLVQFDGSGSTDGDGTIVQYQWDMGDGTVGSGAQYSHTYTSAGSFSATLTVTDNGGLTDTISTPVLVSPADTENIPPTPVISASPTEGAAPLVVAFDASASEDPDGSITRYTWNFSDGTTDTGITSSHTFTNAATYTVTLAVTDDAGSTVTTSTTITVSPEAPEPAFPVEVGEIVLNSEWKHIELSGNFVNPVVVAGPLSYSDDEPAVVRLRNVGRDGFDIRIQEWDYLNGTHAEEVIYYIVMEQGSYTLADGTMIEAGSFSAADQNFHKLQFNVPFQVEPVIMTSVVTYNGSDAVSGRLRRITQEGFEYKLSEQESKRKSGHVEETVGYIAWEPGTGNIGTLHYEIGRTPDEVTHDWYQLGLQAPISGSPHFLAAIQSYGGGDTSSLRYQYLSSTDAFIFIEEEKSKDQETAHTTETVGYMVFGEGE